MNEEKRLDYLQALEERVYLQENLPHLYGWKWYKWARRFFNSTKKNNFLCAANQISKSSTQIRKAIHWATDVTSWPKLWPTTPKQFWYLYPDFKLATGEFQEKWIKEFLPRGPMKTHPIYGWKEYYSQGRYIERLVFNSGVTIYFKTYEQNPQSLQAASLYAIFADEEMPVNLYDELNIRRISPAVNGYFHMVFTATLGQQMWWDTIEERGTPREKFKKDSLKQQVSMYDCLLYDDGTPSLWTEEKIEEIKLSCKSESEIQRRVYGRFVKSEGLQYPSFDQKINLIEPYDIPKEWSVYVGVDPGSGGSAHPAAITMLAVNPEKTRGDVFRCWRGDGMSTTSSDIVRQYMLLKESVVPVIQCYDWAAKDFMMVAGRMGIPFIPANKDREYGQRILNSLFKCGMLFVHDNPEGRKLVWELKNLSEGVHKSIAKDDLIDSMRFAASIVPWDFSALMPKHQEIKAEPNVRQGRWSSVPFLKDQDEMQDEFNELNDMIENYGRGDAFL